MPSVTSLSYIHIHSEVSELYLFRLEHAERRPEAEFADYVCGHIQKPAKDILEDRKDKISKFYLLTAYLVKQSSYRGAAFLHLFGHTLDS